MKKKISREDARKKIDDFFSQKDFDAKDVRRMKKLAMRFRISFGSYRKLFCQKCFSRLRGKLRVSKTSKSVVCASCGFTNRARI